MEKRNACLIAMTTAWAAGLAVAQVNDPTRPAGHPIESGAQTVILRPQGKSGAVLFGEYVEIGSRVGERRVTSITETGVTLTGDSGSEVIRVNASAEKVSRPRSFAAKRQIKNEPTNEVGATTKGQTE